MNLREVLHIVGLLLIWTAAAMLPSAAFGLVEGTGLAWLVAVAVVGGAGGALWAWTPREVTLNPREGIATAGLGWVAVCAGGAVPFLTTGATTQVHLAFFESVSGFTTTGASIFPDVEALPASILLWRSVSQWLGGMGIIVLGVAVLPLVGVGGASLFQAEASGIMTERLRPRIAATARILWGVYALLTVALAAAYVAAGMPVFDAVNHAMACIATGGFSTRVASIGAYGGVIQWITIVGMLVGAVNFTLHYELLRGRGHRLGRDPEFRAFLALFVVAVVAALLVVAPRDGLSVGAIRGVVFSVATVASTTGFATVDFALWPPFGQVVLVGLMFVGGMAGSTAGGLKVVRALVVLKHAVAEIRRVIHPRGVFVARLGRQALRGDVVSGVMAYLAMYMITHAAGTLALTATGVDVVTALSATVASMSSVGPGLGPVGPMGHYGDLAPAAQVVLIVVMLLGRLEFYTLLVLLLPEMWARAGGHR